MTGSSRNILLGSERNKEKNEKKLTLKEIVDLLDNPTTCPFGHPIPGSSYEPKDGLLTLDQVTVGSSYIVDRLPEDDRELLEYFVGNRFLPGSNFWVTDCSIPRGIITLSCGEKELVFSLSISSLIWVY